MSALVDPYTNMSFVTPYLAIQFDVSPKVLLEPYSIYTPIGESILAKKVYRNCPMLILYKVFLCDLVELDMTDFNVILGMD